jgi:alpha-tubulin suppressor-like RCC1 family protein
VFGDTVYFKRKSAFFPPKQHVAPIAMDADICQNANIVLKSGSPRDVGTPLHALAANNPQMAERAEQMYVAANQMKAICDASPLEVTAYTLPLPLKSFGWGSNFRGQLGLGHDDDPVLERTSLTVQAWKILISASWTSHGIKNDGTLWSWGYNNFGRLGLGYASTSLHITSPEQVGTDNDWKQISGGSDATAAIKNDGTLWTWGNNNWGQLGLGFTGAPLNTPQQVGSDTDWKDVVGNYGGASVMALKTDGTLWGMGYNDNGELGVGDNTLRSSPTKVLGTDNWKAFYHSYYHTVAIKNDGTLWGWGTNSYGQLGIGTPPGWNNNKNTPIQIGTDTDWKHVTGGGWTTIAQKEDGRLYGAGRNQLGNLGLGNKNQYESLTPIGTDTDWKTVTGSLGATMAIKDDGALWAWGANTKGLLGTGDTNERLVPTLIDTENNWAYAYPGDHSFAIKE